MIYIKKGITFLLIACLFCSCTATQNGTNDNSMLNYEIMESNSHHSIVLLKEPLNKAIDTSKLDMIADSLAKNKWFKNSSNDGYGVWFYYRQDWKGQTWYASKGYKCDYVSQSLKPQTIEVSGITGDDKQDEINYAANNPPIKSSFDTLAYLAKIRGFSKKKIKQLVNIQLDNSGEVKSFVELCKNKLDSAGITIEGEGNYTHFYHDHFINVWGNASYPLTDKNGVKIVSQIVTFEGAYDVFGNQLYFKCSLAKRSQ